MSNGIKYYKPDGECVVIHISQKNANVHQSVNSRGRVMTQREADFYAHKAGLTRKKPKRK